MRRLLAMSVLLAGCVGSSLPQPPAHDPIEPDRVARRTEEAAGFYVLEGEPGAVHASVELWIWNLTTAEPPVVTETREDGSFLAVIPAVSGELAFRMQTRSETGRSEPIDIDVGFPRSTRAARSDCLHIEREVIFGGRTAELAIVNDCGGDATIGETRLRSTDAFTVDRPAELLLPSGTEASIRLAAPGGDVVEDILFVSVAVGGDSFVYAVTLIAD
jgi:hypothetical protein